MVNEDVIPRKAPLPFMGAEWPVFPAERHGHWNHDAVDVLTQRLRDFLLQRNSANLDSFGSIGS